MSVEGQWDRMAGEIFDNVVRIFAVCGTYGGLAKAIDERFCGVADSIKLHFPVRVAKDLVTDIHHIPHIFAGFETNS
jgi:hypothetical protein